MWSPRGHIFKFLALASKPQVLKNCLYLGSRTALFFEWLKFCRSAEKCFSRPFFFLEIDRKFFFKTFFFRKTLAFVSLASSIPILGLEHSYPWPRIFLCPWLWPRALCPRLHLCYKYTMLAKFWSQLHTQTKTKQNFAMWKLRHKAT